MEIKDLHNDRLNIKLNVHKKWDSLMHVRIISDIENCNLIFLIMEFDCILKL